MSKNENKKPEWTTFYFKSNGFTGEVKSFKEWEDVVDYLGKVGQVDYIKIISRAILDKDETKNKNMPTFNLRYMGDIHNEEVETLRDWANIKNINLFPVELYVFSS